MTEKSIEHDAPTIVSPLQRAGVVAKALGEAARRARFSKKHPGHIATGNYRARRAQKLFRIVRIATFFLMVVIPSLLAGYYYMAVASDQYVSEARFTVRGGMPPKLDGIGSLTGAPSILIIQDTQVIMNFIQSRAMVEQLEKSVDLRALYSKKSIDFISRLKPDVKIEKFVRYWQSMVGLTVQLPSGIVVFTVRGFSPDDAARIADAALKASEALVNQMNDQMVNDALALSENERRRAEANLATTRANLENARNEEGVLSADKTAEGLNTLITTIRGQLAKMQQEYETLGHYVNDNSPQVRNLQIRMNAATEEIAKLQARITQSQDGALTKTLAGSMSKLEYVNLENQIAEKMYASSLALLERARLASETKLMYINTFVHPVPAQEAKYPRRSTSTILFAGGALALWFCLMGLLSIVRKRLA